MNITPYLKKILGFDLYELLDHVSIHNNTTAQAYFKENLMDIYLTTRNIPDIMCLLEDADRRLSLEYHKEISVRRV